MKTLLLMRHAKSSWSDASLSDEDRPLNKRGEAAAKFMGRYLSEHGLAPDAVLCSSAVRARETARRLLKAAGVSLKPVVVPELYLSGPEECVNAIASTDPSIERLLVVGHNPDTEELIQLVTGCAEEMPTGAVACIAIATGTWAAFGSRPTGRLMNVLRPKALEGAGDA